MPKRDDGKAPPPVAAGGQLQPRTTRGSKRATTDGLPADTNIVNIGIDVAALATKKSTTAADKEIANDTTTATANNNMRKSARQSAQKKNDTSLHTDDDNFNENDKVWCYYTYIDKKTGKETRGHWLSAVVFKKICTTCQGDIGRGNYFTFNKDTYIIKYDDDNYYDVNRPSSMLQHRAEDDSEVEDDYEPKDTVPPKCFITLPTISQFKQPPESLLPESNSQHTNTKKKAEASTSRKRPAKKKQKKKKNNNNNGKTSVASTHIQSSAPSHIDKLIPNAFKACDTGWEERDITDMSYTITSEEDYVQEHLADCLLDTYNYVATSMDSRLNSKDLEVNAVNAFNELIQASTFEEIASHTTEQLVKKNLNRVTGYEMKRFFATKFLRSRFNVDVDTAFKLMETHAREKNFTLMDKKRYNNIMSCLRGYEVNGRSGADGESWMRRKKLLRRLEPLEKKLYDKSVSIMMNRTNGVHVIDDEMFESRAKDVENKHVSSRKSAKEGPKADCLSDTSVATLFGMRLQCAGEKQIDNVQQLLKRVPPITHANHHPKMRFDRGYGKESFVADPHLEGFDSLTICNGSGSRNCFITQDEMDEQEKKWRAKDIFWIEEIDNETDKKKKTFDIEKYNQCKDVFNDYIFDSGDKLGAEVRVATKDIDKDDGSKLTISSFIVRQIVMVRKMVGISSNLPSYFDINLLIQKFLWVICIAIE